MTEIGHNSGDVLNQTAQSALKAIFERLENVDREIAELREGRAEILADAKAQGFNKSIIGHVIRLRRQDAAKRQEEQDLIDQYLAAIEPLPLFERATEAEPVSVPDGLSASYFDDARGYVIAEQKASASMIQRKFGISFNRAAAIIEQLERGGVISPADARGRRTVYASAGE